MGGSQEMIDPGMNARNGSVSVMEPSWLAREKPTPERQPNPKDRRKAGPQGVPSGVGRLKTLAAELNRASAHSILTLHVDGPCRIVEIIAVVAVLVCADEVQLQRNPEMLPDDRLGVREQHPEIPAPVSVA